MALAVTFVSLWGSAASAHVTVQPSTAEQGGRGRFVFRVPNESETASTIKLEVQTPKDAATATSGIRVQPKDGWDVAIDKAPLDPPIKGESGDITQYVSKITWTAQPGHSIGKDQFDEFSFTTGVLPKDMGQIAFKAVQTYDGPLADGTSEARWVEERKEGQPDPKRPEPLVKLTPPTTTSGASATPASAAGGESAANSAAGTAADDAKNAANSARTLGILGLILGLVALVVAVGAVLASRKPATGSGATGSGSGSANTAPAGTDA
jgi:uncharacterized protein YcnI